MRTANTFKAALRGKRVQFGLWLGLADPYAAELCATAGFDWLLIDGEHAPNDLRTMLGGLQAIAAYQSHPVVRIPEGDTSLIKQVLEIGATTLLVPMVETAEQARELVRAMRYPPAGIRGVGSGLARSSRWGRERDYLHTANEQMCLLVQVETERGLANIDEIAQVDGVDGVFIGPADLAASLGHLGHAGHPDVQKAIAYAFERIAAAQKASGILATEESLADSYVSMGARFVAVGVDATMLAKAARALIARFRPDDEPASEHAGY